MTEDHYMNHLLSKANSVFWRTRFRIHRYVAAPTSGHGTSNVHPPASISWHEQSHTLIWGSLKDHYPSPKTQRPAMRSHTLYKRPSVEISC